MNTKTRGILLAILAVVAALLAGGGIALVIDDDGDPSTPPRTVTVPKITETVNTAPDDGAPTATVEVEQDVYDDVTEDLEHDLRDTPGVISELERLAPGEVAAIDEKVEQVKENLTPLPTAGASAKFRGCVTRFVSDQSSRGGVRPIWQVWHYTVSRNVPGWADVNAIVAFFNRRSSGASSHFVIDREGHCAYIVPIENKAWTNVAGNPLSIQYEIINYGDERGFMETRGYKRLRSVMRQVQRRTGIPWRLGSAYPPRAGIVQHADGGIAWGGHHDIRPFSKERVFKRVSRPGPRVRRWCAKAHADGPAPRRVERKRDRQRRQLARKHGFRCKGGKPRLL